MFLETHLQVNDPNFFARNVHHVVEQASNGLPHLTPIIQFHRLIAKLFWKQSFLTIAGVT